MCTLWLKGETHKLTHARVHIHIQKYLHSSYNRKNGNIYPTHRILLTYFLSSFPVATVAIFELHSTIFSSIRSYLLHLLLVSFYFYANLVIVVLNSSSSNSQRLINIINNNLLEWNWRGVNSVDRHHVITQEPWEWYISTEWGKHICITKAERLFYRKQYRTSTIIRKKEAAVRNQQRSMAALPQPARRVVTPSATYASTKHLFIFITFFIPFFILT